MLVLVLMLVPLVLIPLPCCWRLGPAPPPLDNAPPLSRRVAQGQLMGEAFLQGCAELHMGLRK